MVDMKYTFRFDDISINTDTAKLSRMIDFIRSVFKPEERRIILAVSPAVHDIYVDPEDNPLNAERVFPSILHTESDFTAFYHVKKLGIPECVPVYQKDSDIVIASHGMAHVDHRLLSRGAQELSILMSCSLLGTKLFVPPFHKWNYKTEAVCKNHGITVVKYDQSWQHLLYHPFNPRRKYYYAHTHDFDFKTFRAKFP